MIQRKIYFTLVILAVLSTIQINKRWNKYVNAWFGRGEQEDDDYNNTKLYKVLEVDKYASTEEIKKAYRKLSKIYHPDKAKDKNSNNRFNEIAEAYEILSDEEKRRMYDNYGLNAAKNVESNKMDDDPSDHFNIYESFFGGGFRREEVKKAESLILPIELSLEQLYKGDIFSIYYTRDVKCLRSDDCIMKKKECSGKGYRTVTQQVAPGFIMQNKIRDDNCIDRGKAWDSKCSYCQNGLIEGKSIELTLEIEPGTKNNDKILFEKKGKQQIGHENGDLVFLVQTKNHKMYERKNNDLHQTYQISLKDALIGFSKDIHHISGTPIRITKNTVTFHNEVLKVQNKGMPIKNSSQYGNLYIKFMVQFPDKLTEKQKEAIVDLF
ncbi:DnaJ protein, putative [Plasmodium berghei]|uniref:DnaJ protein, putative n=2 Tax=Plasmodium berghei TaxID=5821 RepID=A0A509APD3_PLABA|nr:DnaJ protein, putative [Plasmodium berghei ANKA]CXI65823.1 DnaJ protein, putative [Plasmodium berghei]SCM23985.1 DnaJ protein, putative [Plasmodium berghei]SCN26869.1 DnaJ protein, putative [Plasmodium berghei]SCO61267.1 DnaJ protein, putative [Plasmodium berghei]SCO63290.1 DnaJ protein, putative [Plasmodium berghei]|eukprot:XP_034422485.1 DnaJ protein, putative [Plasmodium berghei ANKA]